MKLRSIFGLCLSGSLLLAGQAALADKNDKEKSNNRSAQAIQVHIDKKTGKKSDAADDSDLNSVKEAEAVVDISGMMPAEAEPIQHHADGMMSVKLGTENLKYLVLTIDEDGNKAFVHQPINETDFTVSEDKGEQ